MELAFKTHKLRAICEDETKATEMFGAKVATQLRRRLADLRAAQSLRDLVAGRPSFKGGKGPRMTLDLDEGFELVCAIGHRTVPLDEEGAVDWYRVRRLQVVAINQSTND